MKDKILALLKTKFAGVQDAILLRVATKLAETATTDEAAATAVEGVTVQTIVDSYTESRVTEASQTALKNFREKHGLGEDGKPIKKNEPNPPNPDEPEWFKAHKKQQEEATAALKNELEGYKKEKTSEAITAKVKAHEKLKDIPASFLKGRNLTVESEDKIDELVTSLEAAYAEFKQEMAESGVVISKPPTGGGPVGDKVTIDDYIKEKFPTPETKK